MTEVSLKEELSLNIPVTSKPRVVIIGGGFAGIQFAKKLRVDCQLVLIDQNNFHTFQPLLYQVATAALEALSISYPFRKIFSRKNLLFRMAEVTRIVPETSTIQTSIGDMHYDYLIMANGAKPNYFGMEDFKKNSLSMKSVFEAVRIRNRLLQNMEKALLVNSIDEREALMNVVIVGGGPTGVEMAGAIGELKKHILPHDYPELDFNHMQIHLIDLSDRLLNTMSKEASEHATEFLKKFGINMWLKTKVLSYDGQLVVLSNGKKILSDTVVWAAGVSGNLIEGFQKESLQGSRLKVDVFNKVQEYNNVFALGDIACMITDKTPQGHPMLAPVAIQQAHNLAGNFPKFLENKPMNPFVYKDLGVMATIGRNQAVADFRFFKCHGILGWFIWLVIHLMQLIGFRNKVVVLINWAWNYFTYDRGMRVIIKMDCK